MRKFVKRTSFLRTMSDKRANDFFYSGNAVHGEPDYGLAKTLIMYVEIQGFYFSAYVRTLDNNRWI